MTNIAITVEFRDKKTIFFEIFVTHPQLFLNTTKIGTFFGPPAYSGGCCGPINSPYSGGPKTHSGGQIKIIVRRGDP